MGLFEKREWSGGSRWRVSPSQRSEVWSMRIYLETSVLLKDAWPGFEQSIANVVELAGRLGSTLAIPDSVLHGLEYHWTHMTREAVKGLRESAQKVSRRLGALGLAGVQQPPVAIDNTAIDAYRATVAGLLEEHRIARVPLTACPLAQIYSRAVQHLPPFSKKGDAGFKDTVHLLSILDDLGEHGESGVLVTDDGDFDNLGALASASGSSIELTVTKPGDLADLLKSRLAEDAQEEIRLDQRKMQQAITDSRRQLERFLTENLEVPAGSLYPFSSPDELVSVRPTRLFPPSTPIPVTRSENDTVPFQVEVEVELVVVKTESSFGERPPLKVGRSADEAGHWTILIPGKRVEDRTRRTAVVHGNAEWPGGTYTLRAFTSCALKEPSSVSSVLQALYGALPASDATLAESIDRELGVVSFESSPPGARNPSDPVASENDGTK